MAWWRRMASAISGTIVSDNGLLHLRRQAITGTNADILSAGSSRTIFREIWINAFNSSFKISLLNGLRLLWFLKTLLRHRTWPWYLFFQFLKFSWFHGVWVIDSIRITACEFSVFYVNENYVHKLTITDLKAVHLYISCISMQHIHVISYMIQAGGPVITRSNITRFCVKHCNE